VNVSTRTAYAMGRIGAFPRFPAIVSPRHTSPVYSVLVAFVPAWLTSAGIKVFSFVTPLAPPLSYHYRALSSSRLVPM
jgi:amino acid transporter